MVANETMTGAFSVKILIFGRVLRDSLISCRGIGDRFTSKATYRIRIQTDGGFTL